MPVRHPILNGLGRLGLSEQSAPMIDAFIDTMNKEAEQPNVEDLRQQLVEKAKAENKPMVYMPKAEYAKLDPAIIHQHEEKAHCIIVPAEQADIDRLRQEAVPYTMPPPMPERPEILIHDVPHVGKIGGNKTPKILPKDYAKKKKAKRKMQKQSRRKR